MVNVKSYVRIKKRETVGADLFLNDIHIDDMKEVAKNVRKLGGSVTIDSTDTYNHYVNISRVPANKRKKLYDILVNDGYADIEMEDIWIEGN
jgi:hypothetical protein